MKWLKEHVKAWNVDMEKWALSTPGGWYQSPEVAAGSTGSMHVLRTILVNTQRYDITREINESSYVVHEAVTNINNDFLIYL